MSDWYDSVGDGLYSYSDTGAGFYSSPGAGYDYSASPGYSYYQNTYYQPSYNTTGAGFSPAGGGGTEAVTAYGATPYQIQTTAVQWPYDFNAYTPGLIDFQSPYITPPGTTEAVTAAATAPEYQIQPAFIQTPTFTPGQIDFQSPYITPPTMDMGEQVVSKAVKQNQVQAVPVQFPAANFDWSKLMQSPFMPHIAPVTDQKKAAPSPAGKGTPASAGGGGSSSSKPQPPPLKPPVPPPVTPQQKQALAQLTPDQLRQLLQDKGLSAAQRQAVIEALTNALKRQAQQARAGAAPGGGGGAAKPPAKPAPGAVKAASPLQPAAFALPLLIAAGVATAWGVTHHKQIAPAYRSTVRRVRRVFA